MRCIHCGGPVDNGMIDRETGELVHCDCSDYTIEYLERQCRERREAYKRLKANRDAWYDKYWREGNNKYEENL